jgi:hypothetical protein
MIPPYKPTDASAYPLAPALESVVLHHRLERRDDSMSRFPQEIGSGTGSAYGFAANRGSVDSGAEGFFDRFEERQGESDVVDDDAWSDVTEKMGREGDEAASRSGSRSRPGSFMS